MSKISPKMHRKLAVQVFHAFLEEILNANTDHETLRIYLRKFQKMKHVITVMRAES